VKHVSSPFQMCKLLLVVVACLGVVGCDADRLGYVKKAKYDTLQKQLEKAAQQQVSECQGHKPAKSDVSYAVGKQIEQ